MGSRRSAPFMLLVAACTSFDEPAAAPDGGSSTGDSGAMDASTEGGDASASDRYAAAVLADTPFAFWRLTETTGPTLASSVDPQYPLVLSNGPQLAAGGLFGGSGGAVLFGGGKGTRLTASTLTDLTARATKFAIELWLSLETAPDVNVRHVGIFSNGTQEISLFLKDGDLIFDLTNGTTLASVRRTWPELKTWHHVVAQAEAFDKPRVWIDGTEVGDDGTRLTVGAIPAQAVTFGALKDGADSIGPGAKLAELALYDHVLDPTRIVAHLQAGNAR